LQQRSRKQVYQTGIGNSCSERQKKTNDQSFCGPSLSKRLVDAELSKLPIWESGDRGASSWHQGRRITASYHSAQVKLG
jgi:hypothetical protein